MFAGRSARISIAIRLSILAGRVLPVHVELGLCQQQPQPEQGQGHVQGPDQRAHARLGAGRRGSGLEHERFPDPVERVENGGNRV